MGISEQHYFRLHMGATLTSIDELKDALKTIDDASFKHHVTSEKNDFASWVEHIFGNKLLADKMKLAKTKYAMFDVLDSELSKKTIEKTEDDLAKIKQKMDDLMWKEFNLEKKEDKIERVEEKIEHEVERKFGIREFLYLLLGISVGIIFMAIMKMIGVF